MIVLYIAVLGISIFGGSFIKIKIWRFPVTYLVMGALVVSYIKYFVVKRGVLSIKREEKTLLVFEIYGLIMVGLSFLGFNKFFISDELYTSIAYIPRQAYYLMVLPAILLFQDDSYTAKADWFVSRYGRVLFWVIYFGHIAVSRKVVLSVPTEMILCWLLLSAGGTYNSPANLLRFAIVMFTPIAVGGEITNLLIRLACAVYYFLHDRAGERLFQFMGIGLGCMVVGMFVLPVFDKAFESIFDVNSSWRLRYWKDELNQLVKSYFLGVGYGTSYASRSFVGGNLNIIGGPFSATAEYSTLDKLFVTGPHSSFIAIAFRLGIIGILTFVHFLIGIYRVLLKLGKKVSAATYFAFFAALVIIGVNVGLESPYYLMLFVFSMGKCVQQAKALTGTDVLSPDHGKRNVKIVFRGHRKYQRERS